MKKIILMAILATSSSFAMEHSVNASLLTKANILPNNLIQKTSTPSQCFQYCIELQGGLCRFMPDPNECLAQQRICVQDCLGN